MMSPILQRTICSVKMHKKGYSVVALSVLVIFALSITTKPVRQNARAGDLTYLHGPANKPGTISNREDNEVAVAEKRLRDRDKNSLPVSSRSIAELKKSVKATMLEQEAFRCRVISEYSDGNNFFTLVAIDPPNPEEIQKIRRQISTLMKECQEVNREDFDKYITKLISEYDPFGSAGKRAFFVTISKDDVHPHSSAYSFTVDNFDNLSEKLDPKSGVPFTMNNARWYQNPKGEILERLTHIMR